MAMAGSVGVKPRPHHSTPRRFLGRMSDIGTIEDASDVLPVPSSVGDDIPLTTALIVSVTGYHHCRVSVGKSNRRRHLVADIPHRGVRAHH